MRPNKARLRRLFAFDRSRPLGPQRFFAFATVVLVFVGPVLGLLTIRYFPFLVTDAEGYTSLGAMAALGFLLTSYLIFVRHPWLAQGFSVRQRALACGGFGLGFAALLLGVAGPVNAIGARYETRIVDCVGKRMSRERDPSRRQIALELRPWSWSSKVVEVSVPLAIYDREQVRVIDVGMPQNVRNGLPALARVRLLVGKGSLGLEWPVRVEPIGPVPGA
jgi:hypothetical protein